MENVLGRQLWSIYEDLKRENKIGFLTDDEFQKYCHPQRRADAATI